MTGTTAVNCQPRKTEFEQCSQLFCFQPRKLYMEFLSSNIAMQRLTVTVRRRAMGMLQNGSIQMNVARQFNVSRLEER